MNNNNSNNQDQATELGVGQQQRHKITHVIFDFDGIIVDTERLYTVANERALAHFDGLFTVELKSKMMGRKKPEAVAILLDACGLANTVTMNDYMEIYDREIEMLMTGATEPLPGALEWIEHLQRQKIPVGICTGSNAVEFEQKTTRPLLRALRDIQPLVLCGSDPEVRNGKPNPDAYLVTVGRFSPAPVSPANVLVFEDSVNGVRSALAAGCTVIMVPQRDQLPTDWPEAEMRSQVAEMLDTLEHFQPEKYGLPARLAQQYSN